MIIGISGKKQHGKDTVASIIQYLSFDKRYPGHSHTVNSFISEDSRWKKLESGGWEIKKFADKLKRIVSILIGCDIKQLEDNRFKETPLGEEWRIWYWAYKSDGIRVGDHIYSTEQEAQIKHLSADTIHLVSEVLTPRRLLQLVGTEAGRDILHPNLWVNALFTDFHLIPDNYYGKQPNWIITDVRFPNEVEAIEDRGGIVLRVNRNLRPSSEWQTMFSDIIVRDPDGWNRQNYQFSWFEEHITIEEYKNRIMYSTCMFKNGAGKNLDQYLSLDDHISETILDNYPFKHIIENNSTLEDLTNQVNNFSQLIPYDQT